ncbi:MAG: HAMP domain-containing protein [Kofleriaceae bacterium]|nr:HAMP domain-containing protein [Kofleriaceae bacterium]
MSETSDILGKSSSDGQAIGFKRHLVLPAIIFLLVEILVIVVPLLSIFGDEVPDNGILLRIAVPVLVGAQLVWSLVMWRWLSPLYKAVVGKRRGASLSEDVAMAAYRGVWKIPMRALILRSVLWFSVILGRGVFLMKYAGWDSRLALSLTALGTFHALVANVGRAIWLQYLMDRFRKRLFGGVSDLRCFADGYFRSLMLVCVACVVLTFAAVSAFVYFFLPLPLETYLRIQLYFPFAFVITLSGLYIHAKMASRKIDSYLEVQNKRTASSKGDKLATSVYKIAQSMPYRMLITFWGLWLVNALLGVFFARSGWRLDSDDAFLLLGVVTVISAGAALYQALWHREIFRALLDHLTLHHRLPVRGIRTSLTLRTKLLVSIGGMVFFVVGLAFFWGFIQYKTLVTKYTASQADLGLAWVRSEVQGAVAGGETKPTRETVETTLARLGTSGTDSSALYFFLPSNLDDQVRSYGGGPMGAPALPWYALGQMRQSDDAIIALRAHSLTGRRGPLTVTWRGEPFDLGAIAVFYPTYRGRGPTLARPLRELLVFFLVLFGVCWGIVMMTVGQFVKPIRRLEARADGMARGELAVPVTSGSEGDEVGRLTFALEEMRRALREKLRSTEEVNMDLERAVQRRTADLAKKNRELAETLGKLTRAQDQLIQSEKLASIGQLVAGIAHEINNPVNAIVNTVGPLEEAIGYLDAEDEAERLEAAQDVKDMIRVVQRGAQRTKAIVQALHNYSRTDDESIVEIDLNRSLDDSLELLRHIFKDSINVTRDYQEVGRVVGNAGQMNQVFMNLLTNAGQAVSGMDDASVKISTEAQDDGRVAISIRDNGQGMSPEVMSRVFDPFFTTKDVGEGSGLGLSIVHGIVERHGGEILVESEPGKGTVFRVILPRGEGVSVSHGSPGDTFL